MFVRLRRDGQARPGITRSAAPEDKPAAVVIALEPSHHRTVLTTGREAHILFFGLDHRAELGLKSADLADQDALPPARGEDPEGALRGAGHESHSRHESHSDA